MKEEKKLNLPQSLLLLVLIIFSVAVCIRLKTGGPMIGLFASWIFIYLVCKIVRIPYDNVVAGAYDAIRMVVPTLCLLMAIGVMIGTWLQSGTIATIIAWGLKMINPAWLLPLTLLFCSVLSVVTGTSYGSVGSAGVAMMAIGNAMGINSGMVAGAVICGAMFGDKLSPLSDTTNLAPAVAGAKLGDHIRAMFWTTIPTYIITLIIFTVLGIQQTSGGYTAGDISNYITELNGEFHLGAVTLIPAILIIVLLLCKVNAISALGISSFAAGAVSFFVQHATLQSIIQTAYSGYTTTIEEGVLQSILNRGGMGSMLQYVAIISFAVGMGGMLEKLGVFGDDYDTPDGTGVRDYIHVVDLAKGHVKAINYIFSNPGLDVINLGTGVGYSVLDMVKAFGKACGKEIPYEIKPRRAGDIAMCYADPAKAARVLGWKAEKGLDEMCADTWRWQSQNPNGYES